MTDLDKKINENFAGLVVRKDLVKSVKGNAIVPTYVLEYLLGQYCASDDESTINTGIETVKEILARHYVHRNEANLVRSKIKEKGHHKVIDKIIVSLNDKKDVYEAQFSNLGLKGIIVSSDIIKSHPKLLVNGVWCISELEYKQSEENNVSPWLLDSLKPIQMANLDIEYYLTQRKQFTTDEWIDLIVQSIGFNPEHFGKRSKLIQLTRLIPFCERNYNLIELGPKGTGKSHIYSEFSPHGMLLSGGEVTVPKLFVNNSNGKIGLVGYWDCVAFDEFAGKNKKSNKALVDILKGYMANKTFSRGIETLGAEASISYVGNTQHTVPYMLKHTDLFDEIPPLYKDSAFLDRLYYYLPGWEVDIIRGEMFSCGYGFVVDYLAEVLRDMRNLDFSGNFKKYFSISSNISTRDRDGIIKTFSGLMKIIHPTGEATEKEIEDLLKFSIEGRKRVKDQISRIDSTYPPVIFSYTKNNGQEIKVTTLEEKNYPKHYYSGNLENKDPKVENVELLNDNFIIKEIKDTPKVKKEELTEQYLTFEENQKGVSYDILFGSYLKNASEIIVTDPYIRNFYQTRNFMEFIETVVRQKDDEDEIHIHLITGVDEYKDREQVENFEKIQTEVIKEGINFTWELDSTNTLHARSIVTNTGWEIILDRGLDIFQRFEANDAFSFTNRMQEYRQCKAFYINYIKK